MLLSYHYPLSEVVPYINWSYFFHAWGFPARFASIAYIHGCDSCRATWLASFAEADRSRAAEAMQLLKEAQRFLRVNSQDFQSHFRFMLCACHAENDDIVLEPDGTTQGTAPMRLSFLRQQQPPYLCLADFISPVTDKVGLFVASVDAGFERLPDNGDDYQHLLAQTLADRLAEATVEKAHEHVRRHDWGYAIMEHLSMPELFAEKFQGIRPAVGYPSLPDQSLNFDLDRILDFAAIGVSLTESGAMQPHASVSGLMLAHPKATYFSVGPIGEDQLADYARRRGRPADWLRPFLAGNL